MNRASRNQINTFAIGKSAFAFPVLVFVVIAALLRFTRGSDLGWSTELLRLVLG
jgi:hypothetical protein